MSSLFLDVATLGQVFTPPVIVERMLGLMRRQGRVLEPSCGDGAFVRPLQQRSAQLVAIEYDAAQCPQSALNIDFFTYPERESFDTIIGNPPYVKARDIHPETAQRLRSSVLNGHANLYFYFIEKCVRQLRPNGELIFITPRDFLKATGAAQLNAWLHEQGSFTEMIDLGDAKIFSGALPNCVIWRFEKGNFERCLSDGRCVRLIAGQFVFTHSAYQIPLSSVFSLKVGAVSGADDIFAHDILGDTDFVCSRTAQTGELRRMIYPDGKPLRNAAQREYLTQFKARLLARRVTNFNENNWWCWGRRYPESRAPRIYVNHKTRNPHPFFLHRSTHFDGSVLALFPHDVNADLPKLTQMLNAVDWQELGFVCDGRFLFAQRSLLHVMLPDEFAPFISATA